MKRKNYIGYKKLTNIGLLIGKRKSLAFAVWGEGDNGIKSGGENYRFTKK